MIAAFVVAAQIVTGVQQHDPRACAALHGRRDRDADGRIESDGGGKPVKEVVSWVIHQLTNWKTYRTWTLSVCPGWTFTSYCSGGIPGVRISMWCAPASRFSRWNVPS
jgi:hypothetical protein